MVSTMTNFY